MNKRYQVIIRYVDKETATEELYDIVSWCIEKGYISFTDSDGDVFSFNKTLIRKYTCMNVV